VVSPIEGSPAFRAGLKTGDLISKIDDTPVKGLTLNEAVKRMRGEPDTKVVLTIFRKSENRSFPVTITREEIRTQSVRGKVVEPGYAWMRVEPVPGTHGGRLRRRSSKSFTRQDPNLKGLVLDLRNDPGGLPGCGRGHLGRLPARERDRWCRTNGQLPESKFTYKASAEYYQRRGGSDPLKRLNEATKAASSIALVVLVERGLGLGQRDRRWRPARPQAGHHHGHPDLRQGLGADGVVDPAFRMDNCPSAGLKLTTSRYYTPSGTVRSRPRASCPTSWWTRPRRATCSPPCAPARPTSTNTWAAAEGRSEGPSARKGARGRTARSWKMKLEEAGRRPHAAGVRLGQGFPADRRPSTSSKASPVMVSKTLIERKEEQEGKTRARP